MGPIPPSTQLPWAEHPLSLSNPLFLYLLLFVPFCSPSCTSPSTYLINHGPAAFLFTVSPPTHLTLHSCGRLRSSLEVSSLCYPELLFARVSVRNPLAKHSRIG